MSRIRKLTTGDTVMTQGNALRHYIAKGDKLLKRIEKAECAEQLEQLYSEVQKLLSEAANVLDCCGCEHCPDDDFGYCSLRHHVITIHTTDSDYKRPVKEPQKTLFHCFPATVKAWKWDLKEKAYGL